MARTTLDIDDTIRKKIDDLLSQKFTRVKEVPQEILKLFPFINPMMVFKVQNKTIAFLVEKEVRAPRWVSYVEKNAASLERFDFEIGIVTPCEEASLLVLPDYRNLTRAFSAENFGLYIVRNNKFECFFHRNIADSCKRLADEQIAPFIERLKINKHIPSTITQKMRHLRNSCFSNSLKDIAIEYDASQFDKPDDEYDFIQHAMKDILKLSNLDELERALNFLRLTENELKIKGRRDHFLHSFQVFLVGEIIIERHIKEIKEALPCDDSGILSLERSWLLASLLHDIGFPFQYREWIYGIGDIDIDLLTDVRNRHFLDDLTSHFSKANNSYKEKIGKILYNSAQQTGFSGRSNINHGLISAIQLLKKSGAVSSESYKNEVLPAALSMSLHDREIWHDLVQEKLVPMNFLEFPTVCLLILCDHLEGYGRPGRKADPQGSDVILTNLNVSTGNVYANLWFNKISEALLFEWETKEILNLVLATGKLFNFSMDATLRESSS